MAAPALKRVRRGGTYYRVCKPEWADCADTSYAKLHGGRWNARGVFGALYLCATLEVAAANARAAHAGRAIRLFSLRPDRRPQLQRFEVTPLDHVDAVTATGVAAAGLPATFPYDVSWPACQAIGRAAFAAGAPGVACRSAAECTPTSWLGEELAVFDGAQRGAARAKSVGRRRAFADWYPDLVPR